MREIGIRLTILVALLAGVAGAQEYNGPPPEQADLPYLLHAENLVPTEKQEAREVDRNKETAYVINGAASPVRTPLAEPIFIILSEAVQPQDIQLYEMEIVKGNRETAFPKNRKKRGPRPKYLTYKRVEDDVYWIEVNEGLDNGQYCLTPRGANSVFCFAIY